MITTKYDLINTFRPLNMFLITLIGEGNTFIIWVSFYKFLDCNGVISSTKPLEIKNKCFRTSVITEKNHVSLIITYNQQTGICLPKGQCIEGSGLNSFPSHSIVFLSRLFHSHKYSLQTRNKMSRIGSGKLLEKPNKMLGGNLQ